MLINKTVATAWSVKNKEWYVSKGYVFTKIKDKFIVKVEDLTKGANVTVSCMCDGVDCKNPLLENIKWQNYLKCVKDSGKYYCSKCSRKLFGIEKQRLTRLKNGKSFADWCIENNCKDVLDRWDYKLNNFEPYEITYSSKMEMYFKCPRGIHESEVKKIAVFTSGHEGHISCKQCNSFEQWCLDNSRKDILDRWDYELNKDKPSDISYSASGKRYFKCPKGIHNSEIKHMNSFVHGQEGVMDCKACNSFGQYLINSFGTNALELYWDYEKNNINPFVVSYASGQKVWLMCQEKEYHGSYYIACDSFSIQGSRCSYCTNRNGIVHPLDSLGNQFPKAVDLWSDNNSKSPFEYSQKSHQEVYWKCSEGIHKDYKRTIINSNNYDFRCPECQYSQGESSINHFLLNNGWISTTEKDYEKLLNNNIDNYYIPQKTFDGLQGIGNGLLSYDFYLPSIKLLIEYQGNFHDGSVKNQTKQQLDKQKEHDKRKNTYAKNNNMELLEIWYWEFDKIEEILSAKLKNNREQV